MMKIKVRIKNMVESSRVQGFLLSNGFERPYSNFVLIDGWLCVDGNSILCVGMSQAGSELDEYEKISFDQLRDMVVLKRNDPKDANFTDSEDDCYSLYLTANNVLYYFNEVNGEWEVSLVSGDSEYYKRLKPIQNNDLPFIDSEESVKEYLNKVNDFEYELVIGCKNAEFGATEVPCGANEAFKSSADSPVVFSRSGCGYNRAIVVWQRNPQKESLNDKVASAEAARQEMKADNVNNPSHYNKGGIECIEAIKASMTHEAFCGYLKGNVQKYMWRYEVKGGVESLQKAQWYLNKLIEVKSGNS